MSHESSRPPTPTPGTKKTKPHSSNLRVQRHRGSDGTSSDVPCRGSEGPGATCTQQPHRGGSSRRPTCSESKQMVGGQNFAPTRQHETAPNFHGRTSRPIPPQVPPFCHLPSRCQHNAGLFSASEVWAECCLLVASPCEVVEGVGENQSRVLGVYRNFFLHLSLLDPLLEDLLLTAH